MRILLLCFVISLTHATTAQAETASPTAPPFKVGILIPLTGIYAEIGADNREGIDLVFAKEHIAPLITPIFADSRADPTQAVNEFRKLATVDKVQAVFTFRSPVGMAIRGPAKMAKVPLLGGVGHKDFTADNPYTFQLWPRSDIEGAYLADRMIARGYRSFALLTTEDDWTASVSDGMRTTLRAHNAEVLLDEILPPSELDFRSLAARIRELSPDAVVVNLGISQIGPAVRQFRELHIDVPFFSNFFAAKPEVLRTGQALEGLMFVALSNQVPGLPADASGATVASYIGAKLLTQAAKAAARSKSQSLYEALLAQQSVTIENVQFPIKERCVEFPLDLQVIREGRVATLGDH